MIAISFHLGNGFQRPLQETPHFLGESTFPHIGEGPNLASWPSRDRAGTPGE